MLSILTSRNVCAVGEVQINALSPHWTATTTLRCVYRHPDDVDFWTAGLAEQPVDGSVFGPTFSCIVGRQFYNLKAGNRYWFENKLHNPYPFTEGRFSVRTHFDQYDAACGFIACQHAPGCKARYCFFTARRYLTVGWCLSVCLSRLCILSKRLTHCLHLPTLVADTKISVSHLSIKTRRAGAC